jgi:phenylacetate-CoA oxygenase PaaH subunit
MPTYEVFLKSSGREGFGHVGSLDAPDDGLAAVFARETYVRRGEGEQAWVVRRTHLIVVEDDDLAVTLHRVHTVNDGSAVAERRRNKRASAKGETL